VLRSLKLSVLRAVRALGGFRLVGASAWRRRQLLILCYHGISLDDEHVWGPALFMAPDHFARRLDALRRARANVLPLGEALERLKAGTLPKRAVAITFDDGNHDFHREAWPRLRAAGMPVTVYLTTYYCLRNLPVFPVTLGYMLWKSAGQQGVVTLGDDQVVLDARSARGRQQAREHVMRHARAAELSAVEKDALLARVADALGFDYDSLRERRLLHIMTPDEVRELAQEGVDFQLHTHRHRSPLDRAAYQGEIAENRAHIEALTGTTPTHFCYPSGVCMPEFDAWLADEGVESATTCESALATASSPARALPRLLDHSGISDVEFEAWVTGAAALLPRRTVGFQAVDQFGNPAVIGAGEAPARTPAGIA
jgi:peptidoglycan/xylan/chitin deacetylase (PgdA/CDA1 family)